jgi:subtilisin family serine protease
MKLLVSLVAGLAVLAPAPAHAATPNQLYYTVAASYEGAPEDLWEIATRFLGSPARAGEILDLNAGRVQPDGDRLAEAGRLHEGWHIVLPFDAVGTDLHRGALPATAGSSSDCPSSSASSWVSPPADAWRVANGAGVKVAVIGSGVDGAAPALAGRVTAGADVAAGTGRADTGCDGPGTAMAGIVAGDDDNFGVAPGAQIFPVRVNAEPRQTATAIRVAVTAGAEVVLLNGDVGVADTQVRAAISEAISKDAVVVLPSSAGAEKADGLLRVGALDENHRPADTSSGDVLAPGVKVASIGGTVTGPEYAAAYAAGAVALIRSAHPELHAFDVTRQLVATAAEGVVSPVAAVTSPLPAGVGVNATAKPASSTMGTLSQVLLWLAVALALLLLLPFLLQRPARMLSGVVTSRMAERRARETRARLTDDANDPFWEPPTGHSRDEPTEVIQA